MTEMTFRVEHPCGCWEEVVGRGEEDENGIWNGTVYPKPCKVHGLPHIIKATLSAVPLEAE